MNPWHDTNKHNFKNGINLSQKCSKINFPFSILNVNFGFTWSQSRSKVIPIFLLLFSTFYYRYYWYVLRYLELCSWSVKIIAAKHYSPRGLLTRQKLKITIVLFIFQWILKCLIFFWNSPNLLEWFISWNSLTTNSLVRFDGLFTKALPWWSLALIKNNFLVN